MYTIPKYDTGASFSKKNCRMDYVDIGIGVRSNKNIAEQKNTLRIDLWSKDMPVEEMKGFYIDCIGGLAQNLLRATGDEFMAGEMNALCQRLVDYLKKT